MPRLRKVEKFIAVRAPDRILKEKWQDQLDQGEEIEETRRFHGKKIKKPGYIRGIF
jgi:hypothetical protein